ncbi:MAG TPA: hypothetical protein VLA34_10775, partial [Candidatus Krumholzibacterium sp.]|nr:hypothetical protein [Candidatus Krumholzibacterium sp.]
EDKAARSGGKKQSVHHISFRDRGRSTAILYQNVHSSSRAKEAEGPPEGRKGYFPVFGVILQYIVKNVDVPHNIW